MKQVTRHESSAGGAKVSTQAGTGEKGKHSLVRDIPIRFLVVSGFLLAGLLPILAIALLALNAGTQALQGRAMQQLDSVASLKRAQIQRHFEQRFRDVRTLASNPFVKEASEQLCSAFHQAKGAGLQEFVGQNGGRFQAPKKYIEIHDKYVDYFKEFRRELRYYDVFILDKETGDVCFSVEKESDFATRVPDWDSPLADVWSAIRNGSRQALSDTRLYQPSFSAAAQFVAAPVLDKDGTVAAIVALQVGMDGIQEILADQAGMGTTGESYLVGPDYRMRSDSILQADTHSVAESFKHDFHPATMETQAVNMALDGQSGSVTAENYRGRVTLASFAPIHVGEVKWALVAEMEEEEIKGQIDSAFNSRILLVLGLSALAVLILGLVLSRHIVLAISRVTSEIANLGRRVHEGELCAKGSPQEQGADFRPTVLQINDLLDAFVTVLDMVPVPLVVVDPRTQIRFANKAMELLLGHPRQALAGRLWLEVCTEAGLKTPASAEPDAPLEGLAGLATLEGGGVQQRTSVWVDPKGATRHFTSTAAPLGSGPGVAGAIEVLVEQTEIHQMAAQNADLLDRIHRIHRLDSLGTLSGGIAHDFNNILGYLFAFLDIAHRQLPDQSPAKETLDKIGDGIQRASDLVQQILAFSRQARNDSGACELTQVVRQTLALAKPSLSPSIQLVMELGDPVQVRGDAARIQQVVLNLFTNAWQAMPQGGVLFVSVTDASVSAAPGPDSLLPGLPAQGRWVQLSVSDTGTGIPDEMREHIFEPFFSGRPHGQGNGLGLAVVHGIVKGLGGAIEFESQVGKGTCFRVYLPEVCSTTQTVG